MLYRGTCDHCGKDFIYKSHNVKMIEKKYINNPEKQYTLFATIVCPLCCKRTSIDQYTRTDWSQFDENFEELEIISDSEYSQPKKMCLYGSEIR